MTGNLSLLSLPHISDFTILLPCFRGDVDVSAVCQYQSGDFKMVFDGPYKEYREASQRWGRYTGAVPSPRPGSVRNRERKHRDLLCCENAARVSKKNSSFFICHCIKIGRRRGQRWDGKIMREVHGGAKQQNLALEA